MNRAVHTNKTTHPRRPARATTWVLLVGAMAALLAANLYLLWVGFIPSVVPLPIDGHLPVPWTIAEPKAWHA